MFKKGDVVEWSVDIYDRPVTEDRKFSVMVTEEPTALGEFSGVVVERAVNAFHNIKYSTNEWDVKQFKLKQQTVVSDSAPDNAFPVLKDGMVIETRCRGFYLVCADKVMRHDGYNRLASYEKNGKHKGSNSNFDIVRVYSGEHLYNFDLYEYVSEYPEDLVWNGKKNAEKIASLQSQVDSLQEQIKQLEEEDNV